METHWHSLTADQAVSKLGTSIVEGLNSEEVQKRREKYGFNEIVLEEGTSPIILFLSQFKDALVIILLAAVVISAILGLLQRGEESTEYFIDAIAISVIVILNAILGFIQEYRAEKAVKALKRMTSPQAVVLRNKSWERIPSRELVPGDIVKIEMGDKIPADGRLISSYSLRVDESSLTGESMAVNKNFSSVFSEATPLADRKNMVYMGTTVVGGGGIFVVTATGLSTEFGKIARYISEQKQEDTPLQRQLSDFGQKLGIGILIISAIIFVFGYLLLKTNIEELFIASVGLAVAAIPEGLPAVVTLALAIGVQRMASRNALVKRLPAVETLGSCDTICTDKTGTLTENAMTVRKIVLLDNINKDNGKWEFAEYDLSGGAKDLEGELQLNGVKIEKPPHTLDILLRAGVVCNNAILQIDQEYSNKKIKTMLGDPTEISLLIAAEKLQYSVQNIVQEYERVAEIPFDSKRKRMTVIVKNSLTNPKVTDTKEKIFYVFTKGAPEVLLGKSTEDKFFCSHYMDVSGNVIEMTELVRQKLLENFENFASRGYRLLAIAYKPLKSEEQLVQKFSLTNDETLIPFFESELIFLGFVAIIDPPRKEVPIAIAKCKSAGIRILMITGDHKSTAVTIGKQIGLVNSESPTNEVAVEGAELKNVDDERFIDMVRTKNIFARVTPEHKLHIVTALKSEGHIVAMTGDGVNDAPALKKADIGVAMGITGTDVARESADMILADDNFATIVNAIEEGRKIYDNMKKFIVYLLACNSGEVLTMLIGIFLGLGLPLLAIQLLWINLVTDGLPALALGVDPPEHDMMKRKPRDPKESLLPARTLIYIAFVGLFTAMATIIAYWLSLGMPAPFSTVSEHKLAEARGVAFTTLVLLQMTIALTIRTKDTSLFSKELVKNKYLVGAVVLSVILHLIVLYFPFTRFIFRIDPITLMDWVIILAFVIIFFVITEVYKWGIRRGYLKPLSA